MKEKLFAIAGIFACVTIIAQSCSKQQDTQYEGALPTEMIKKVPITPPRALTSIEVLGKMIYFEPIASPDDKQSCASCHASEYGFSQSGEKKV